MKNAKLSPHLSMSIAQDVLDETAKLKVSAVTCPLCGYTIYSRARHDYRSCKCGAVSVDGGFDYMKGSWDQARIQGMPQPFELGVDATKKELYEDWNNNGTRFGLIGPATPAGTDRPRTRRAPAKDRKPVSPRRKNPRSRG